MSGLRAVVLAGGAARRLSGVDKMLLTADGVPLLGRVLSALAAAEDVVVVGPHRDGFPGVRWVREEPPGGGPVAGLAAGLAALASDPDGRLAVFAGDLPGVVPDTVARLVAALDSSDVDGAVLVDADGRRQWLCGVWREAPLRAALPAEPAGAALRRTVESLRLSRIPARAGEAADVDTPADADRLR